MEIYGRATPTWSDNQSLEASSAYSVLFCREPRGWSGKGRGGGWVEGLFCRYAVCSPGNGWGWLDS